MILRIRENEAALADLVLPKSSSLSDLDADQLREVVEGEHAVERTSRLKA